jgi:hypothetical protein
MQQELKIFDMDVTVDAAGTLELARVSSAVIKSVVKAVSDVVVAVTSR